MNLTKKKKGVFIAVVILILVVVVLFFVSVGNSADKEVRLLNACWNYNYESVEELAADSDLIALVTVIGAEDMTVESDIPYTTFTVEVITPVYHSTQGEEFLIYMTGGETDDAMIQIEDDPLLVAGDEILVFCKENTDGTYQILSGSQGRLVYDNGTLSSLNVIDSDIAEANAYSNINIDHADADTLIEEIQGYVQQKDADAVY